MHILFVAGIADVPQFPGEAGPVPWLVAGGGLCAFFVFLVALIGFFLVRGLKPPAAAGPGLMEDLAAYPPSPKGKSSLTVLNRASRLRLIVLAPVGKRDLGDHGEPEELLNKVMYGLGDLAKEDKARIRLWPPQLSNMGFAPSFFRNTRKPGDANEAAHWTLLAGPAKAGDLPLLIGLAIWSEQPTELGQRTVEPHEWVKWLSVER